ncbi:GNAT family N-acetyltransferase [Tenacibaculum geojense]|uniref:GNAT family N-acetyltransferase n=1 Tax=Tenacibaculum geojense TaxID=915352 RepID=A0ABW3JRY0_9FLAO
MNINYTTIKPNHNKDLATMIRNVFYEFDAPKEGTVYTDTSTDALFELFKTKKSIMWVAEVNNIAVGCCGIFPTEGLDNDCGELVKFYLSDKARGLGIGKELLLKSIKSAKELGYNTIYLESLPLFKKAIQMYEEAGFEYLSSPLGNSGHSSCDVWMLKKL